MYQHLTTISQFHVVQDNVSQVDYYKSTCLIVGYVTICVYLSYLFVYILDFGWPLQSQTNQMLNVMV